MIYSYQNFFISTFAIFKKANRPNREPDYISFDKEGAESSRYWYTEKGVYRESDHWGSVSSCYWAGNSPLFYEKNNERKPRDPFFKKSVGFCKWEGFKKIEHYDLEEKWPRFGALAIEFRRMNRYITKKGYPQLEGHPNHLMSHEVMIVDGVSYRSLRHIAKINN